LRWFGTALSCRWPWLRWGPESRPWAQIPASDDRDAVELFKAGCFIHLQDGMHAKFWSDASLPKRRSVLDAWTWFIPVAPKKCSQSPSAKRIAQYLQLWDLVAGTTMTVGRQDEAVWRCTKNGKFSVSSAYKLFFITNTQFACAKPIWRSKAPMRCKFFMWLAVHKRCLTADNLERRGWPTTRNALSASLLAKIVLTSSCTVALLDRFGAGSRLGLVLPSLYLVLRSRIPNTGG
jgi:hypothetical protein